MTRRRLAKQTCSLPNLFKELIEHHRNANLNKRATIQTYESRLIGKGNRTTAISALGAAGVTMADQVTSQSIRAAKARIRQFQPDPKYVYAIDEKMIMEMNNHSMPGPTSWYINKE
jgi:hypothetical protein